MTDKSQLHLYINSYHHDLSNTLFYYLTFLGEGWTALIIAVILLFVRYRYAVIVILSYALSSVIVQYLKHFVYSDHDRPVIFFKNNPDLYLVPGVDNNIYNSFPSGHSTTAFAIYLCLALFIPNKWSKLCLFMLALLVGWSRVYLSQHFFEDIYAGSFIGVASAILIFMMFTRNQQKNSLDASILKKKAEL